jgi:hypothetical protein
MDDDEAALAEYLEAVRAMPRLRPIDEPDVLAAARVGEGEAAQTAMDRAVEGYQYVTALLALHLAPAWINPLDAIAEACLVLMRLVQDPNVPRPVAALTPALVKRYAELNDLGSLDGIARYRHCWDGTEEGWMLVRSTEDELPAIVNGVTRTLLLIGGDMHRDVVQKMLDHGIRVVDRLPWL